MIKLLEREFSFYFAKPFLFLFLSVLFLLILPESIFASHIAGGEITYQCLGNNQYLITLNLYHDCDGIAMNNSETINVGSSCGTQALTANLINAGGTEVSQICPQQVSQTSCNGGGLQGMEQWTYQVTATMIPCSDWVISWDVCCRNTTVNIPTSSGDGSYFEATLNSVTDSCNNSPTFASQPIPYVCSGQPVVFNWGTIETEGDSVTYQLISARDDLGAPLTYTSPYSATNPINGITIDPFTGEITFTPGTIGNFILVVRVNEYDAAGNLIGTIMRDIQFVVIACTNNPPPSGQGQIDTANFSGTANLTGPYSIEMCDGGTFSFTIVYADPDTLDTLTLTSNVTTILPGSAFNTAPGNPASATISWTAPGNSTYFNSFTVFVNDGACPVPGIQSNNFQVAVIPGTVGLPDTTVLCGTQVAPLAATGGNNFFWSVISGDPLVEGVNFSCDSCPNPIASPSVTTLYEVVSDLTTATCVNRDTVQVKVVPEFTYVKSQSDSALCLQEEVQFSVTPDATSASYSYDWTSSGIFNNDSISSPIVTFYSPGTKTVYFEIISQEGCAKNDSMQVVVSSAMNPNVMIVADTTICFGDSTLLDATILNAIPQSCGLSASGCFGSPTPVTIGSGTGTLSDITYPAPYGNWYWGAKHQILFLASELQALGFQGGQITSLALNVESTSGTTTYNNFNIKMGCTSITTINSWQTGLVTVFPSQTINITTGWNTHTFATGFDWDGNSNIVVEICFNNSSFTNNSPNYYTPTTFTSVLYYRADNSNVCSSITSTGTSVNRPNIKFNTCGATPPSTYIYSWVPGAGLSDSSIANPWANPPSDALYTVTVTDTVGGCSDTASVNLQVVPNFIFSQAQSDTAVCLEEQVQFLVIPDTSSPSYTFSWIPGNIFNDSTIANPVATFNSPGNQVVIFEIANNGGCNKKDSMQVVVSPYMQPVVGILGDTLVCVGDSTQLTAIDNSSANNCNYSLSMFDSFGDGWNGATLFFWEDGNLVGSYTFTSGSSASVSIPVTNGSSLMITFTSGTFPDEESYTLFDSQGNILLQDGPSPANGTVFTGTGNCPGPGFLNHSFSWNPPTWLNNPSASNPFSAPQADTSYSVIVTDNIGGCSDTASVNIYVNNQFNFQKAQSEDSICLNESVQFTLTPDSGQGYIYQWAPATYLDSSTIANPIAGPMTIAGNYTYYFTISNGCERMDSMKIIVSPGSVPIITIAGDDSICVGDTTQLVATSSGGISPTYSFDWTLGTFLNDSTISNPIAAPPAPTTYTLIVTDTVGNCADTTAITILVGQIFNFNLVQSDTAICLGESVQLNVNHDTGTYIYQWSPPANLNSTTISNPIAGPMNTSGNFSFTLEITGSSGCTLDSALGFVVSQGGMPDVTVSGNDSICEGDSAQVTAISAGGNSPTYSFYWSPGSTLSDDSIYNPVAAPMTSTTYSVIVADTIGHCTDTALFSIVVVAYPTVQVASLSDSVCINDNFLVFSASPPGGTWIGTTSNDTLYPGFAGIGPHNIIYTLTLPPSCSGKDTLKINIYPNPAIPSAFTSDTPYCAFSNIDSVAAIDGGGFITWYSNSALTDTLYSGNPMFDVPAQEDSFDVWVTETSLIGCESNGAYKLTIAVIPNPDASFSANPAEGFAPLNVSFSNTSLPDTNFFSWDFAGLGASSSNNPAFIFNQPGTYEVILISVDANGCADTTKATVIVNKEDSLNIPNVFTPNGDGNNDLFMVKQSSLSEFSITIFSRWGKKVYESKDPLAGWDGKDLQGQQVHPGVYFYVVSAKDRNGNSIVMEDSKGTVTLLRD